MYDAKLLTAAQQGDEAAFAALYDRNVDAVHDLCWGLVGDESEVSRLVAQVFVLAARHLGDISDASQIRPWLLAIARHRILTEDEEGTLHPAWGAAPAADPLSDEPLPVADLRRWTRSAAATLALSDQVVVELAARHDLDGDQLAAAIGCSPEDVDRIVAQVEQEANEVLGALVVARQGRRDCPELAEVLEDWDGRPAVDVADAVGRHTETCERCRRRRSVSAPLEALAGAPVMPAPADLRNDVLAAASTQLPEGQAARSQEVAAVAPAVTTVMATAPPPALPLLPVEPAVARPWALIAGIGVGLVLLVVALVLILNGDRHSRVSASPPTGAAAVLTPKPTPPPTAAGTIVPVDTSTTSTTSTAPPAARLALDTSQVQLGTAATSAQVVLTDSSATSTGWHVVSSASWLTVRPVSGVLAAGGSTTVTLVADRSAAPAGAFQARVTFVPSATNAVGTSVSVVGTGSGATTTTSSTTLATAGPSIGNVSASPSTIQASPCPSDRTTISATVTDPAGVSSVAVSYSLPDGQIQTAAMTQSGDQWSATITASSSPGKLTFQVTATDTAGITTTSSPHVVTVGACAL